MSHSEIAIMDGLAEDIRSLVDFKEGSVLKFDQSILDSPSERSPYFVFLPADVVRSRDDGPRTPNLNWEIKGILFVRFDGWGPSLEKFSQVRFALLTVYNNGDDARSAGGLANVSVDEVRANGPVGYRYLSYNPMTFEPDGTPIGIEQEIVFTVEDY